MLRTVIPAAALLLAASAAFAEEHPIPLADAPGRDVVEHNCGGCHSLDYIRMNSPFLSRKGWEAEVGKMINSYGAPIEAPDATTIIDYLSRNYGSPG